MRYDGRALSDSRTPVTGPFRHRPTTTSVPAAGTGRRPSSRVSAHAACSRVWPRAVGAVAPVPRPPVTLLPSPTGQTRHVRAAPAAAVVAGRALGDFAPSRGANAPR